MDIQTGLPVLRPTSYLLNLDVIRNNYGYSTSKSFYILVYAKNASGLEDYMTAQFFRVLDNGPAPSIVGINEDQNVCSSGANINLTSSVAGYTVSSFTISDYSATLSSPAGVFSPGHASINGAGIDEQPLRVTMNYSDFNNCPSSVVRNFNWVKKPPLITVSDTAFCQFGNPALFKIEAKANRSADRAFWYDENPALPAPTTVLDSVNFVFKVPGIDGQNDLVEDFFVRQSYKGCKGDAKEVKFYINPAPDATITKSAICEDRIFNLSGPEQSPGVPYAKYEWFFGDGETEILPNDNTTTYNYGPNSANTLRTITLIVTTGLGCTAQDEIINTVVSPNPVPDFTYKLICEDDVTQFNGSTSISVSGTDFAWNFGDLVTIPRGPQGNPAPEGHTIEDPDHKFANGPGNYNVTITTYSPAGCFGSTTKTVTILDTLIRTSTNPYLMSDAADLGRGFWRLEDINGNSTWSFSTPATQIMNEFSSPAWVTNPTGLYSPNEYSFLNSPCLNIQNVDRPVLSLDYVLNIQQGNDGIVIEFSKDGGVTWSPLGNVNSGFNWYNTNGFTVGNIGVSSFGWSGNSWELPDNIAGDTLVQGRRALDNIAGLTNASDRAKIRLRIAFKTNGDGEFNGFAFNNLTIGSRNRVLLVENFTNQADGSYTSNNTAFKLIPTGEVVKVQYHVGAPGADENYNMNTADPSARAAFYGIPLNDISIPRGYIDGYSNGNFIDNTWVSDERDQRSLKVAPYSLAVKTLEPEDDSYLKILVTGKALQNIPASWKPVLQIAVVEKTVGTNEYVLRKLVPSAVGKRLQAGMLMNNPINIEDSVRLENMDINFANLAIVAFIQDEQTREVYQATLDAAPAFVPTSTITGTEDDAYAKRIYLYPNPANHEVNIELPAPINKSTPVEMFDAFGRVVYQSAFHVGEKTKTVSTANFADGIYMMQLITPNGNKVVRKIMVTHR